MLRLTPVYDSAGNVESYSIETGSRTYQQSYGYDAASRLNSFGETATGEPPRSQGLGYDGFGNRWVTSAVNMPGGTNVPLDVGWYDLAGSVTTNRMKDMGYDAAGNLTQLDPYTGEYDAENRLTVVNEGTTARGSQQYDGNGRRIRRTWDGVTTTYVYDAAGNLMAEYGGAPAAATTQYLFADHLGSTRLIVDGTGACQQRIDYLPFGQELPRTESCYGGDPPANPAGVAVKFTGKERDAETGLDYFGARYLGAAQGRFVSPDGPLVDQHPEDPQSWNLFTYTRNNPLKYVDPTGNAFCSYSPWTEPEGGAAKTEKACKETHGRWVYQPRDTDDPNADAAAFQFSVTKTENTGELSAAGQEFFQGNAELWNNTAGAVNTAAAATGAVLTLPVVVPAAASAAGNAVGFGYGLSTLGSSGIVLGRVPTYIQAARTMGARALNMPNWLYRGLDAIGEGWTANRVYIDTAVRLGKQVYLSNSPLGQGGSIFAQELRYLQTRWGIAPSTLPRTLPIR